MGSDYKGLLHTILKRAYRFESIIFVFISKSFNYRFEMDVVSHYIVYLADICIAAPE